MRERLFDIICGVLIIIGSVVFLNGGRQHPATDSRLGPMGSEAYFRGFAEHIAAEHHWEPMHGQILVGPILWAIGAVALCRRLRKTDRSWPDVALVALSIGTATWILAFVFDGFVAPAVASSVLDPAQARSVFELRENQLVVIRSGLIGWILIGLAMCALGAAMVGPHRPAFALLGAAGILIGLWPVAAWLNGTFAPGPFISPLWRWTALVSAAWFVCAGATLFLPQRRASIMSPAP